MQLMPSTAEDLGVDLQDPRQNVIGGATHLANLIRRLPAETTEYPGKVLGR